MMFPQVLRKVLAHILIHVRKIFNWGISFKMLFWMCQEIREKELWSSNFQNDTFKKNTITVAEDALIQVAFPNVDSKRV